MVAWNSFAHTEFFADNGRTVQLPATEPMKTGVALVFGDLTVRKVVVDSPAAGPFTFVYRCTLRPEGSDGEPGPSGRGRHRRVHPRRPTSRRPSPPSRPAPPARSGRPTPPGWSATPDSEATAKTAEIPVGGEAEIPVVTITNRAAPSPSPTTSVSPTSSPTSSPSQSPTVAPTTDPSGGGGSGPGWLRERLQR